MKFRKLRADEIDCRVAQIEKTWCTLLLYKDARVDQNILDESVGCMNWQKRYVRDNANCIVGIWDEEKKQWVEKEDTGTESFTEKEKGLASDSQKRSGFAWGIGRELYTSPFIWVGADKVNLTKKADGKPTTFDKFRVEAIEIKDKEITGLAIKNQKNERVFLYKKGN